MIEEQNENENENKEPTVEQYWEIFGTSSQDDLRLLLRLFVPNSGMLWKKKDLQWAMVQSKVLPLLSVSTVKAKEEELRRGLIAIAAELIELNKDVDEDEKERTWPTMSKRWLLKLQKLILHRKYITRPTYISVHCGIFIRATVRADNISVP
jgi:hypothetical protein